MFSYQNAIKLGIKKQNKKKKPRKGILKERIEKSSFV